MNRQGVPSFLPVPPGVLEYDVVQVRFVGFARGKPTYNFAPGYNFRIFDASGQDVGYLNLRVADSDFVQRKAGHIGFGIAEIYRGCGYATMACRAVADFVAKVVNNPLIICDSRNLASIRTIENLGATFLDEIDEPEGSQGSERPKGRNRRYRWDLPSGGEGCSLKMYGPTEGSGGTLNQRREDISSECLPPPYVASLQPGQIVVKGNAGDLERLAIREAMEFSGEGRYEDNPELVELMLTLNRLGVAFSDDYKAVLSPSGFMEIMQERGQLHGPFARIAWSGPGQWELQVFPAAKESD